MRGQGGQGGKRGGYTDSDSGEYFSQLACLPLLYLCEGAAEEPRTRYASADLKNELLRYYESYITTGRDV